MICCNFFAFFFDIVFFSMSLETGQQFWFYFAETGLLPYFENNTSSIREWFSGSICRLFCFFSPTPWGRLIMGNTENIAATILKTNS